MNLIESGKLYAFLIENYRSSHENDCFLKDFSPHIAAHANAYVKYRDNGKEGIKDVAIKTKHAQVRVGTREGNEEFIKDALVFFSSVKRHHAYNALLNAFINYERYENVDDIYLETSAIPEIRRENKLFFLRKPLELCVFEDKDAYVFDFQERYAFCVLPDTYEILEVIA